MNDQSPETPRPDSAFENRDDDSDATDILDEAQAKDQVKYARGKEKSSIKYIIEAEPDTRPMKVIKLVSPKVKANAKEKAGNSTVKSPLQRQIRAWAISIKAEPESEPGSDGAGDASEGSTAEQMQGSAGTAKAEGNEESNKKQKGSK